ncbi:MAG: hypothetical protein ACJAXD_001872 [Cryomorphaceae bacterium]|jgi:hypothetical protein
MSTELAISTNKLSLCGILDAKKTNDVSNDRSNFGLEKEFILKKHSDQKPNKGRSAIIA